MLEINKYCCANKLIHDDVESVSMMIDDTVIGFTAKIHAIIIGYHIEGQESILSNISGNPDGLIT